MEARRIPLWYMREAPSKDAEERVNQQSELALLLISLAAGAAGFWVTYGYPGF